MHTLSASAPGRVELLGNHTDYNEGVVLSAAINYKVSIQGEPRSDGLVRVASKLASVPVQQPIEDIARQEGPGAWANYPFGVVSILREEGFLLGGADLMIDSDLPQGAGLSSSAALEVATARLLMKIFALEIEPMRLAKICRRAENDFVGVKCGLLDQVSSIFGRRGNAVYLDCRAETVDNIPLPANTALLVFHCGVEHQLTGGEYNERRAQCFSAAAELGVRALRDVSSAQLEASRARLDALIYRRAAHIVGEDERVFAGMEYLRQDDGKAFGELMFESHESSRVNFENSTPELDLLVELAREEKGVLGSRLTGGGFGGATISLVERDHVDEIARHLEANYTARTGHRGRAYPCESSDGAQ